MMLLQWKSQQKWVFQSQDNMAQAEKYVILNILPVFTATNSPEEYVEGVIVWNPYLYNKLTEHDVNLSSVCILYCSTT